LNFAYVLINCQLGAEEAIIKKLKQIENVKEVHGVFGVYDIIVKIEAANYDTLQNIITTQIRKMEKISSTLTMMIISGQENQ